MKQAVFIFLCYALPMTAVCWAAAHGPAWMKPALGAMMVTAGAIAWAFMDIK